MGRQFLIHQVFMIYSYSLEEADFLTHQLFVVSNSKSAIARRRRSWIILTGVFLILAWLFYRSSNETLTYYFLTVAIISAIFYPFYSRWHYRKHYKRHVKTTFSKSIGQMVFVEFQNDHILTKDDADSESKVSFSQIESMTELPEHFLIRLNGGQSLILPQRKISELSQLRSDLEQVRQKVGLEIIDNTNWKWR